MANSAELEKNELMQMMSDMEKHAMNSFEPGSVPVKNVFLKQEKKKKP